MFDTKHNVKITDKDLDSVEASVHQRGSTGAISVELVDASGDQIVSFGGGTQYTEGDSDATITGTAMMMERDSNTLTAARDDSGFGEDLGTGVMSVHSRLWDGTAYDRTPGDSTNGMLVNLGANNDVTVSGTVTANLSATDNAVLDNIDADTSAIQTAVELIDDAIIADDDVFTPATTKVLMSGFEYDDTTPDSVNEGDAGAARMSANRNIYTQIRDAAGNERGVNVNASNQLSVSVDNTVIVASHAVTNAGTFAVQESGSALTALQLIDDIVFTDDNAFTPASSKIAAVGFFADETATDSVDEGDTGIARMTLDRKQIISDYAHTTGGGSSYSALSTAAVIATEIKGSAGQVYSIQGFNNGANEVFVRLYNQTGAPGTGDSANIVWRGMIPGNAAGAGFTVSFPKGKVFATGIGIRVSAAVADNDNTNLTANEVMINVDYK